MSENVLKCNKCGRFYVCGKSSDIGAIDKFKECGGQMQDTGMTFDEYLIISKISQDNSFLEAMIDLKQSDPIEFQLKMSQFKANLSTQESSKIQTDTHPKCPTCGSTNLRKISTTSKVTSVAMWGIFSKKINKSFECKSCGYTW